MKVYSVKPGENSVRVSDGRTIISDTPITWGEKLKSIEMATLCKIILADVLGDVVLAERYAHRFKWRTVMQWDKDTPHGITETEVMTVVNDIRAVENENKPLIDRMQREKPQFVTDRAGPGQVFTSNPELTPNKPKEAKNGT
jgi:hypothetical protein